jgi:beta-glucosidase
MTSFTAENSLSAHVESLLSQMTLRQKIGQMTQPERMSVTPRQVRKYHIGSVLSGGGSCPGKNYPGDWVDMNDAYWTASMDADDEHLAIPLLYGVDAIHGHANVLGATVFPHNIGLGACNDPDLIERIASITAKEILATGVDWTFAPTLAVARDHRWGRTYESYSEDPSIVSAYADRFVIGMQSDLGDNSVIACAKHWVGDGGTLYGMDQGETRLSYAELARLHIAPYRPAIDAGVLTVMVSFNSWNGDKCHGHRHLVTDVLKGQLGFNGFVISDWDGINYLSDDFSEAVAIGVNAGTDMFMVAEDWLQFIEQLQQHVSDGIVSIERIDDAVRRILTAKFMFGLFDKPRPAKREWSNHVSFGSTEHRDIARDAVRKSLVLLKNEGNCLPLSNSQRILVAGRNANNRGAQCGGFTVEWQGTTGNKAIEGGTSIWEGIKEHSPGAVLSIDGREASANSHDVAIVVIGEHPYAEGMGDIRASDQVVVESGSMIRGKVKVLEAYGTTLELAKLHPEDLQTIRRIREQGIPVVCVLVSGRPLIVNLELIESTAFIAAWLPGSEGKGVAEVLFGEYDFKGRLSFSWPRHAEEVLNIGDTKYDPLFSFGFGLSYD